MDKYITKIGNREVIFSDESIKIGNVVLYYDKMNNIKYRSGDNEGFIFDYGDRKLFIPSNSLEKDKMMPFFQKALIVKKPRLEINEQKVVEKNNLNNTLNSKQKSIQDNNMSMKSFNLDDIMKQLNILPKKTEILSKISNMGLNAFEIEKDNWYWNIELKNDSMSIDEFIEFAKNHNSDIYYKIYCFDFADFVISGESINNNSLIKQYISDLSNDNLDGFIDKLDDELFGKLLEKHRDPCYTNYIKEKSSLKVSDFIEYNNKDYEDEKNYYDNEYLKTILNTESINLLNLIDKFNNSIPVEINEYVSDIMLACIINNIIIGIKFNNYYKLDTTVCLAELLKKYEIQYNINIEQYKKKQKQKEEEKLKKQNKAKKELEKQLLKDKNFAICTNMQLRRKFAEQLFNEDEYKEILYSIYDGDLVLTNNEDVFKDVNYSIIDDLRETLDAIYKLHKKDLNALLKS